MIIFGGGVARAGGKEPNSLDCMAALYFNGIPAGHTLSRAPSPEGHIAVTKQSGKWKQ